jgi:hypothetical protein
MMAIMREYISTAMALIWEWLYGWDGLFIDG